LIVICLLLGSISLTQAQQLPEDVKKAVLSHLQFSNPIEISIRRHPDGGAGGPQFFAADVWHSYGNPASRGCCLRYKG